MVLNSKVYSFLHKENKNVPDLETFSLFSFSKNVLFCKVLKMVL